MKYVVVVGDGMADYPIPELGNKTPLQVAHKPNIDKIAAKGRNGLLRTVPDSLNPGSRVILCWVSTRNSITRAEEPSKPQPEESNLKTTMSRSDAT